MRYSAAVQIKWNLFLAHPVYSSRLTQRNVEGSCMPISDASAAYRTTAAASGPTLRPQLIYSP